MGIPEMVAHPSSQDPGGFWENMKAGMLPAPRALWEETLGIRGIYHR